MPTNQLVGNSIRYCRAANNNWTRGGITRIRTAKIHTVVSRGAAGEDRRQAPRWRDQLVAVLQCCKHEKSRGLCTAGSPPPPSRNQKNKGSRAAELEAPPTRAPWHQPPWWWVGVPHTGGAGALSAVIMGWRSDPASAPNVSGP